MKQWFLALLLLFCLGTVANATQTEVQHVVARGVTCGTSCPSQTLTLGAGHLLFIEAAPLYSGAVISSVICTPNCGSFTVPGAACRAFTTDSQGIDCAYALSTLAGTTSITVNLSVASAGPVDLFFREYSTTVTGGFKLDNISSAALAPCTACNAPSVVVTNPDVVISGGGPGQGSFGTVNSPFANLDNGGAGTAVSDNINATVGTGVTANQTPSDTAAMFTAAFTDGSATTVQHSVVTSCTPSTDSTTGDPGTTTISRQLGTTGAFTVLTTTAPSNCAYTDSTVVSNTTYTYEATAVIDGVSSLPSNIATVTIPGNALVTPVVTVTVSPSSISKQSATTATVKVAGTPTPTPTGTVILNGTGYTSSVVSLVAGTATITVPAGTFKAGTYTLTGTYAPDVTSSTVYTGASATASLTVTNSPPTKLTTAVQ